MCALSYAPPYREVTPYFSIAYMYVYKINLNKIFVGGALTYYILRVKVELFAAATRRI